VKRTRSEDLVRHSLVWVALHRIDPGWNVSLAGRTREVALVQARASWRLLLTDWFGTCGRCLAEGWAAVSGRNWTHICRDTLWPR